MSSHPTRFSLLLSTVHRVDEVKRLLDSLAAQTYKNFELIVVDQNEDDRLGPVLSRYEADLPIRRVRSERGLSRARNAGLPYCTGEIIGMPDDDCWYPPDLLENVSRTFDRMSSVDFLSGRSQDELAMDSQGRWSREAGPLDARNIWSKAISFTIFFRRAVVERVGQFDERLGVGAGTPWQAGEETDYLLRALSIHASGWYEPSIAVFHPQTVVAFNERTFHRALSYGRGMGFVLRKHGAEFLQVLGFLIRPLAGAVLSLAMLRFRKAKFHWLVLKGRYLGWLES